MNNHDEGTGEAEQVPTAELKAGDGPNTVNPSIIVGIGASAGGLQAVNTPAPNSLLRV